MMFKVFAFALAVFGASSAYGFSNGFNGANGYNNNLNGGFGTVDVCRCVKTVLRPQIRTEIASIPTMQHYVRTEAAPVVEHIPYSFTRRVDNPGFVHGGAGAVSGGLGGVGGVFDGVNGAGLGGVNGAGFGGVNGIGAVNGAGFGGVNGAGIGAVNGAGFGGAGVGVFSGVSGVNTGFGY